MADNHPGFSPNTKETSLISFISLANAGIFWLSTRTPSEIMATALLSFSSDYAGFRSFAELSLSCLFIAKSSFSLF